MKDGLRLLGHIVSSLTEVCYGRPTDRVLHRNSFVVNARFTSSISISVVVFSFPTLQSAYYHHRTEHVVLSNCSMKAIKKSK